MVVFLPKSIEILAHKGSQTTRATPRDNLASWNRKPTGQRDLLASMTMDQKFPGKETHCRNVFISRSLRGALRRTTQYWARLPKPKAKPAGKIVKTAKCAEEQDNESTDSFQNYDSRRLSMFMYQGWYLYEEKKTSFLTLFMANFGQRLLRSKSWRQRGAPPVPVAFTKEFFSFLDRMVLFLSSLGLFFFSLYHFFYSYKGLSPALYFSTSNDLSISKQLPRVCILRDVNKIWK